MKYFGHIQFHNTLENALEVNLLEEDEQEVNNGIGEKLMSRTNSTLLRTNSTGQTVL